MELYNKQINIKVNGASYTLDISTDETLSNILRERLGLTGTKVSCEEGECGACTVILDGKAVNSCIVLGVQSDGREITTIEGLEKDGQLDLIQTAYIEAGAVQCGYCTPGMIMSTKALLQENPCPNEDEIKDALEGNLCRCTGYTKIIEAVKKASKIINKSE